MSSDADDWLRTSHCHQINAVCLHACRSGAEVVLFEREATCGGHTLTDDSGLVPVDLGFQVHLQDV